MWESLDRMSSMADIGSKMKDITESIAYRAIGKNKGGFNFTKEIIESVFVYFVVEGPDSGNGNYFVYGHMLDQKDRIMEHLDNYKYLTAVILVDVKQHEKFGVPIIDSSDEVNNRFICNDNPNYTLLEGEVYANTLEMLDFLNHRYLQNGLGKVIYNRELVNSISQYIKDTSSYTKLNMSKDLTIWTWFVDTVIGFINR